MQRLSVANSWITLPILLCLAGAMIIGFAFAADVLGVGGGPPGFGPNQISIALSGLAILIAGVVLISPDGRRNMGEWLLIGAAIVAITMAADLLILGGLPGFGVKHLLLASVAASLLLIRMASTPDIRGANFAEWLNLFRNIDLLKLGKLVGVVVQLGLLVIVIRQYELENQAFHTNIMLLTFYGFLIHAILPRQYRLSFFLILSLAAISGILGLANGIWLIVIGLGLIGICHLPIPFSARTGVLLVAGIALVLLRIETLPSPVPVAVWPVLGSMFMFRLMIYMYDLKHGKLEQTITSSLSYFFLLPNIVFLLFPVVDYKTFRRTYYNEDEFEIYQKGLKWIFWGVLHLLAYRFINYYLVISPLNVADVGDLVHYLVPNFLLMYRVSGQFHIAVGILCLFGFNLPRTFRDYFVASSFTDFWRRANIYWKDFILKIFYYPLYFRLSKMGAVSRLIVATIVAFIVTWFLHAYQWFWLRGSFLIAGPDIAFWSIFGLLVLGNSLYETKYGRKRTIKAKTFSLRDAVLLSLRIIATFSIVTVVYSIWTSSSLADWFSLWSVIGNPLEGLESFLPIVLTIAYLVIGGLWSQKETSSVLKKKPTSKEFFRSATVYSVSILAIFLIGSPVVYNQFGGKAEEFVTDMRSSRLSDRDAAILLEGYYEDLIGVDRFNSDLWEIYSKRPTDWPLIQETEVAQLTNDFYVLELIPNQSIQFHGATFSTNRWGMRDQDYEMARPPDTYRIALLGPSFVMGSGIADDENFEWLNENRLNNDKSGGAYDQYEILNFGTASFSLLQELAIWENKAVQFEPNAVILIAHQLEAEISVRNLANSVLEGHDIPYDFLRQIVTEAGVTQDMIPTEAERLLTPYGDAIVEWAYNQLVMTAQEQGVTPIWVFMPTLEAPLDDTYFAKLADMAEEAGFVLIDLSEVYDNQDLNTLIVAEWDKHPNARANRLIAERLYQALLDKPAEIPLELSPELEQ